MNRRCATACAALVVAVAPAAMAQHADTALSHFAAPNLSAKGVRSLAANCAPCHGTEGRAVPGSALPSLAGRDRAQLLAVLRAFKEGAVPATVMQQLAKGYSDAELAALAEYFSHVGR